MSDYVESLLATVSADAPSGSDLEYDPEFARMEKAAVGTPDQQFGSTVIEAQPPDWAEVRTAALGLLTRTHDLRIATYFAQAELVLRGLPGLRDALTVISGFVTNFWETVFPQLDPDDDNDPTIRVNALMGLSNVGGLIRSLRSTPIIASRSVGKFSWMDYAIARGELPAPEGMDEPPTQKKIEAAVQSCKKEELQELNDAVNECLKCVAAIDTGFSDRLGYETGPNLELLTKELKTISKIQSGWLAQLQVDEPTEATPEAASNSQEDSEDSEVGSQSGARSQVVRSGPFHISRREEAIEGLDKIITWFERFEPSSPLPMLLKRAKRLSTMSFIDILRDISPDGLGQAVLIGGPEAHEPEVAVAKAPEPERKPKVTKAVNNDDY